MATGVAKTADSSAETCALRRETTGAVIVTYDPDRGLTDRLQRIRSQVAHVIVVDNTGGSAHRFDPRCLAHDNTEVIGNDRNLGVATALNQGLKRARELGLAWVVMLDQDSVVDEDMVARLAAIYDEYPDPGAVGLIAANARSRTSGLLAVRGAETGTGYLEIKTTITSGSALAVSAYDRVGPFRDDFFIDGIDLEYCLRLRRHGLRILCSRGALMTHSGGDGRERRLLGRTVVVGDHEPWRYYYMMRNFVEIVRLYFRDEPVWVLSALTNFAKTIVKIGLYERHKGAKLVAIVRGIRDGIRGSQRLGDRALHC